MRKTGRKIIAVLMMLAMLMTAAAAEVTEVDRYDVTYEATADGCTIVSISDPLKGYGGALPMELPEQLDGHTVTALGSGALENHSTVGTLTLPASLERIESGACRNAYKLTGVVVPGTVVYIADDAFEGCHATLTLYGPADCYAAEWALRNGYPYVANDTADTDFRSFCWGASKDEVIAEEGSPESGGASDIYAAESISYVCSLLGLENYLTYYFSETEGLYAAQYITVDFSTVDEAYAYVNAALEQISRKYGVAVLPGEISHSYGSSASAAQRIMSGDLEYGATFRTDRSEISVWLTGGNNSAYIYIYYCSMDILPRMRDQSDHF